MYELQETDNLGWMNGSAASWSEEGIVPLCVAFVRPHLDTVSSIGTWHREDQDKQGGAWGDSKVVGLEHLPCEEGWRSWDTMEKGGLRGT